MSDFRKKIVSTSSEFNKPDDRQNLISYKIILPQRNGECSALTLRGRRRGGITTIRKDIVFPLLSQYYVCNKVLVTLILQRRFLVCFLRLYIKLCQRARVRVYVCFSCGSAVLEGPWPPHI
jgi:hypothetical protein